MRGLAALATAIATLGAASFIAVVPVTAAECTYTFPPEGGSLPFTATDGDVICGGPGPDVVQFMLGGTFYGGRRH